MKSLSIKKILFLIFIVLCTFSFSLLVVFFINKQFSNYLDKLISYFISEIIIKIIVIIFSILVFNKMRINFKYKLLIRNANSNLYNVPAIFLLIMLILVSLNPVISIEHRILFYFSQLSIGFAEEFVFRGIIFSLLIKLMNNYKYNIYVSILISSLIFGVMHYSSLFSGLASLYPATNQVIFAFSIGIYLATILIITKNIVAIAVVHSLINIVGSFNTIVIRNDSTLNNSLDSGVLQVNFIYFLLPIILLYCYYLLKKNRNLDIAFINF